jgi:fatty acid desaturase
MLSINKPMSHGEYVRHLKPLLPAQAFIPTPRKLAIPAVHLLVIFACYAGIQFSNHWFVWLVYSVVIGHSLACIAFVAHELSHNSIIRNRRFRYSFEMLFWGLNFISPTLWNRVHTHTHHFHTNTPNDPDRQFLTSEISAATKVYTRLFYPNQRSPRWNPLVGFHFIPYILRNTVAVFYPNIKKSMLVPTRPTYTPKQKLTVGLELVVIALLQTAIFFLVGGDWNRYIFASPIAVLVTSSIVMGYVFTNHFLNPIIESTDPLANSTSIVVPQIFNHLHSRFSYHTEHHLFPDMNSDFYPQLSGILLSHYGERYNRVGFADAWSRLWSNELYVSDPRHQKPFDG